MNISRRATDLWAKLLGLAMPLLLPAMLLAAKTEEELAEGEARLEGFKESVRLESAGSTAPYYLLLIGLAVVALIVLFKNAKRTHLD